MELLHDKHIPLDFLHWGRVNLPGITEEEELEYFNRAKVVNSKPVRESNCITDSQFVVKSERISNSKYIYTSKDCLNCTDVSSSTDITDSSQIFSSSIIFDSNKVFRGQNVNNSKNICFSSMISDSLSVIESVNVFDSSEIRNCENLTHCFFCAECKDLSNSMFCFKTTGEYMLFNKPIDKQRFELFEKQYKKFIDAELDLVYNWPNNTSTETYPLVKYNYSNYYLTLSKRFWNWLKTLPGYDENIVYSITMLPQFMTSEE